jgi:5-oxoprolinase (ATP-hydrolysing) subunit A
MYRIDLNCDLGEGTGNDAAMMPYISSASIACGFHAGDADTMFATAGLCADAGVSAGAHPSFHDRANFGRTEQHILPGAVYELMIQQLLLMEEVANAAGTVMRHVKPHGALYNMAARDMELANAIARAVKNFNRELVLFGLSGSKLIGAGKAEGLITASEVFADRTYQDDGSLTPRSATNALITDREASVQQVLQMIKTGTVTSTSGNTIPVAAETVCLHGDGAHALDFAKAIHGALKAEGILIEAVKFFTT